MQSDLTAAAFKPRGWEAERKEQGGVHVKLEYFTGPHLMNPWQSFALVFHSFNSQ